MKHTHYKKPVAGLQFVDVYRVLALFGVTDPCLQHAVKKLLVAGGRGAKDISQDVQEAIDTLQRWQEMRAEDDKRCMGIPIDFGQQHTIEPASLIDDESPRMQAIGQNGPSGEHYDELEHLRTAADFADDVPVSVDEAIELGAKPIGDCKACQTFAMACTGACEGVPDCDCDRYQPGKVIPCNGECERQ